MERIPRIAGFSGGGGAVWRGEEEEVAGKGDRAVGPSGQWHKGEREREERATEGEGLRATALAGPRLEWLAGRAGWLLGRLAWLALGFLFLFLTDKQK